MPSETFKPPAQIYTTTLYDAADAFTMLVLPARSLSGGHVPNVLELSDLLGVEELERLPVWTLPMIFDVMMGRPVVIGPEPEFIARVLTYAYRGGRTRGPSAFAQYLAYAPIVPFEASPPKGRALSELVFRVISSLTYGWRVATLCHARDHACHQRRGSQEAGVLDAVVDRVRRSARAR